MKSFRKMPQNTKEFFVAFILLLAVLASLLSYKRWNETHVVRNSQLEPMELPVFTPPPLKNPSQIVFDLKLESKDDSSVEDSKLIELKGKMGSGVIGVEVWNTCDGTSERFPLLKTKDFFYKISVERGNLCRNANDFVVIATLDSKEEVNEKVSVNSNVGIRSRQDLHVWRFLDEHRISNKLSIEDSPDFALRIFPSDYFKAICDGKSGINLPPASESTKINDFLKASISVSNTSDENSNIKLAPSAAAMQQAQIDWFDIKKDEVQKSVFVPMLPVGFCKNVTGFDIWARSLDRIFIQSFDNAVGPWFLINKKWVNAREYLLTQIPIEPSDLHNIVISVRKDVFAISETTEVRNSEGKPWFSSVDRAEYLFSVNDGSFIGVIWHRRR